MKTLILIFFLIFLFAISPKLTAQSLRGQALIDSLEAELPNINDVKEKVDALNKLSFNYYMVDPDKGIAYGNEAVKTAEDISYMLGAANAYNALGVNYAGGKADYETASQMYLKSLEINKKLDNRKGLSSSYNNLGLIYQFNGDLEKAVEYFEKAVELFSEVDNKRGEAGALNNIGNIYNDWSDFAKALEYFQNSMNIYKEIEDKEGISFSLNNIGLIYSEMNEKQKAMEYYFQVLEIKKEMSDKRGIANTLSNIATTQIDVNDFENAKKNLLEAKGYFEKTNNIEAVSNVHTNLGILYKEMRLFEESKENFIKAYELRKDQANKVRIANALANIGSVYYAIATDKIDESMVSDLTIKLNFEYAVEYFEKAIEIYLEEGELLNRSEFSRDLSFAYEKLGDKEKALKFYKDFHLLQDSIFNNEKTREIENLIRKQERAEKQKLEQEKIERRNQIQYSAITIATIILFSIIFYLTRKNISFGTIDTLTFIAFLLLYEFILVITEPWVDNWTDNVPIYKLLFNIGIALILIPLQKLELKIKEKIKAGKRE